jgi:hypothetical protein
MGCSGGACALSCFSNALTSFANGISFCDHAEKATCKHSIINRAFINYLKNLKSSAHFIGPVKTKTIARRANKNGC